MNISMILLFGHLVIFLSSAEFSLLFSLLCPLNEGGIQKCRM